MFELTGNVRATRDSHAPAPKLRRDGSNFPYRMFFDDNSRVVDAESLAELIEQLIPGYLELDEAGKAVARKEQASRSAFTVRISILGGLTAEEEQSLDAWEWNVLSSDESLEESYPLTRLESDDTSDEGDEILGRLWSSDIPLVLEEEDFAPFTDLLPPMSVYGDVKNIPNLIWFRSSTEDLFLDSLARVGLISYGSPRVEPTQALR